jgi:hypothetical protein
MDKVIQIILLAVGELFIAVIIRLLQGLSVILLWNWLVPTLFEGPTITFVQALGLSALCELLFKASGTATAKK